MSVLMMHDSELAKLSREQPNITSAKIRLNLSLHSGASIPMGQGDTSPPIFGLGRHYHECPPNISRV